ncbi:unnamed protein product, partial [Clonostachys rhizophaga]
LTKMALQTLEPEDHGRDAQFAHAMHGKSGTMRGGLTSLFRKNSETMKSAAEGYFKYWTGKSIGEQTNEYATRTKLYYDLVTDFYEYGWGQSFHFCRSSYGESFSEAITRHEHYLAHSMNLKEGMKVLDVGSGVGGPARQIAKFSGVHVTGININDYQIRRANCYASKSGQSEDVRFVKGDFMQMPFEDKSFDAVYSIEATVHAPNLEAIYREIFRVLKPGGVFGVYEWVMTDDYDDTNPTHRDMRLGLEMGGGIVNTISNRRDALEAIKAAGFEVLHHEDLARRTDAIPWYWPFAGRISYAQSLVDCFTVVWLSSWGLSASHKVFGFLESLGLAPTGTKKTADSLALTAAALAATGQEHLFSPMYLMIGRKPA